ncbi:hypothetical protein KAI12_03680 [Candidatus Bathyarchaeota archaeon]|nr:hypothetical protein [Candidatus Bathyarchaeota archaeon]
MRKFDLGRELLKLLAIITMTIDHIGVFLYPELVALRIVGRLAFPLFAYLIVLGVDSTHNVKKYLLLLLFFAIISQVPYSLALGKGLLDQLNILFTLFLGALMIYFFNKRSPLALIPLLLSVFINVEGGIYALATIACIKIITESPKLGSLALILLNTPYIISKNIQAFSLAALPIILLHTKGVLRKEIMISENSFFYSSRKYAYYVFYPLHLTIFFLVQTLFLSG